MSEEEKIKELENELALAKAEAEGLGSQLLDVQQDCINARKAERERIKSWLINWAQEDTIEWDEFDKFVQGGAIGC